MKFSLQLYANLGIGTRFHVRMRHLLSPLRALEGWIPKAGTILDLGCGHGLFTNYMALTGPLRKITGIDPSVAKIEIAKKTESRVPNVRYFVGDINDAPSDLPFDVITIVDVVYLIPEAEQWKVFKTCHRLLSETGLLILKTQDTKPWWRFAWTYTQEAIMTRLGVTYGKGLTFIPVGKAIQILESTGFDVKSYQLPSRILYPNVVLVCRKNVKKNTNQLPGISE